MNFAKMSDAQLIAFRDAAKTLHARITNNIIALYCLDMELIIKDEKRLTDLIYTLTLEAHNELCNRFCQPKKLPQ